MRLGLRLGLLTSMVGCAAVACGGGGTDRSEVGSGTGGSGAGTGGVVIGDGGTGTGGTGLIVGDGGTGNGGGTSDNPATCAEAASNRTYVGCEFWPTITYNKVHEGFDFAVVLANGGTADAQITVEGGALGAPINETVPAGGLKTILLPWVPALKGNIWANANTSGGREDAPSVRADGGAYKVTSTIPVSAWQFNPLQYAKSGVTPCYTNFEQADCFSVSNDASLLVPTTAMTGNYRLFGFPGDNAGQWGSMVGGFAITATQDATNVTIQFGPNCENGVNTGTGNCVADVGSQTPLAPGSTTTVTLNAGDVVEYMGIRGVNDGLANSDISGSIVAADKPVQVISFNPLTNVPDSVMGHGNADHIEELVLPGEVIGADYLVAPPTSPNGAMKGGHLVRFVGNVDGTTLTYENQPAGAPTALSAGEVVQIETTTAFRVTGNQPFAVTSIMYGGWKQSSDAGCTEMDGHPCSGDPAISMMVAPEQFRKNYTFLAPTDYDVNFADILVPDGAEVTLDGASLATTGEPVAAGWTVHRVPLTSDAGGIHNLSTTHESGLGLQVMGFGHATSYYYPGGLNLKLISQPPILK